MNYKPPNLLYKSSIFSSNGVATLVYFIFLCRYYYPLYTCTQPHHKLNIWAKTHPYFVPLRAVNNWHTLELPGYLCLTCIFLLFYFYYFKILQQFGCFCSYIGKKKCLVQIKYGNLIISLVLISSKLMRVVSN